MQKEENSHIRMRFGTVHFEDSATVVFSSRGDTLYRYRYIVDSTSIFLEDQNRDTLRLFFSLPMENQLCIWGLPLSNDTICYKRWSRDQSCP